jgi:hypothetical protein
MAWQQKGYPPPGGERPAAGRLHPRHAAECHRSPTDVSPRTISQSTAPENIIEIISIKPVAGASSVKAFVSVRIGEVTIHGAKIVQQVGQHAWVSMPDRAWVGDDGQTRYKRLVELDRPLAQRVTAAVLEKCWRADG